MNILDKNNNKQFLLICNLIFLLTNQHQQRVCLVHKKFKFLRKLPKYGFNNRIN